MKLYTFTKTEEDGEIYLHNMEEDEALKFAYFMISGKPGFKDDYRELFGTEASADLSDALGDESKCEPFLRAFFQAFGVEVTITESDIPAEKMLKMASNGEWVREDIDDEDPDEDDHFEGDDGNGR